MTYTLWKVGVNGTSMDAMAWGQITDPDSAFNFPGRHLPAITRTISPRMDSSMLALVQSHSAVILGILFGLSEALASIPSVRANSLFQLVYGLIQKEKAKSATPAA